MITMAHAIRSLVPDAEFSIIGDTITWHSPTVSPVTSAQITIEMERLQAAHAATQYRRDRVYPPIGDQLDDLFRQGAFSPEMAAQLQAVKTAHPKGTL